MSAREILHKKVSKSDYKDYLRKSEEFYATMQDCFVNNRWNSACLEAVHAVICANDALIIWTRGIKCSSPRHEDAITLLQSVSELKGIKENANHLLRIIKKKNAVEYEGRNFNQNDAEEIVKHTERFIGWIRSILP